MPSKSFDYIEKESRIFGKVRRPLIDIEIKTHSGEWLEIKEVLADTGADISILPRNLAHLIMENVEDGKTEEIKGIAPYANLIVFIHDLTLRIGEREFTLPVAIADSDDVPPILGRVKGLDLFASVFDGKKTILQWE